MFTILSIYHPVFTDLHGSSRIGQATGSLMKQP